MGIYIVDTINFGKNFVKYSLNYNDTRAFIKKRVEEHFKSKAVTPCHLQNLYSKKVEEHFKSKAVTPAADKNWQTFRWMNTSNHLILMQIKGFDGHHAYLCFRT